MPNSKNLYQYTQFKTRNLNVYLHKKWFLHDSCKHYMGHFGIILKFCQYMFYTSYVNNTSMYYILP